MKFFPGIRSCWGGTTVKLAAERSTAASQQDVVVPIMNNHTSSNVATRGRSITRSLSATKHWKPTLNRISENNIVSEEGTNDKGTVSSDKKKSKAKSRSYSYGNDDHWKSSGLMGLSVVSATPFLF